MLSRTRNNYMTGTSGPKFGTLVLAAGDFGRPYAMPPNTPAEHIKTIREALAKTLNDEAVKTDGGEEETLSLFLDR